MRKTLLAYFATILTIVLLLSGCTKTPTYKWEDLKYVTDNYSLEDAKDEGYVIIEDLRVTSGKEIWQEFVNLAAKKKPCKVRVVHYYTLDDRSRYDEDYYESIKDKYPVMYIHELVYDGGIFVVSHYEDGKLIESEFKFLKKYEGDAETPNATYSSYVRYVLVNDDKVTWEELMRGMLSSRSGAYIPHYQIYTDLID